MKHYTLQDSDVGKSFLRAFGRVWLVTDFMGRVLPGDVGKRVYLWRDGEGVSVENDEQRERRLEHAG